jgi:enamine deaminase RidA (YjgF/YER057c/UK114 family)
MHPIDQRLNELGLVLPQASKAVANYKGFSIVGNLIVVSGQLPLQNGEILYKGCLGKDVSLEIGQQAARLCGLNILSQLYAALENDWSKLDQCVRLGGFVASTAEFCDHPKVVNGASDLMVDVLGDLGRHARAAVGVSSLPLGACVEVEALFSFKN